MRYGDFCLALHQRAGVKAGQPVTITFTEADVDEHLKELLDSGYYHLIHPLLGVDFFHDRWMETLLNHYNLLINTAAIESPRFNDKWLQWVLANGRPSLIKIAIGRLT